jgi:high affinity Mn2+ porin
VGRLRPGRWKTVSWCRAGWTAGAGVEVALAPRRSARLEYLYTQFNGRSVTFPAGAQSFASDLSLQSVRLGLNYKIGQDGLSNFLGQGPSALELDRFAFHGQTTYVQQYALPFRRPIGDRTASSQPGP